MLIKLVSYVRTHAVAFLALSVALGGTSYAAVSLPANSVGSKQLKKAAVTPAKVAPATVQLFKGRTGATGAAGTAGAAGPAGVKGDTGAAGAKGDKGETGGQGSPGTPGTPGTNG